MRHVAERLEPSTTLPGEGRTANELIGRYLERIEHCLAGLAPAEAGVPERLSKAMRYSLLSPGKRTRALLTMLAAEYAGGDVEDALVPACAVEMVHAASLALDDLPVMDDASLRRGRPTSHRIFGEETAILSAVALMNDAFGHVARCQTLPQDVRLEIVSDLSDAIGLDGLVAGQEMDLHAAAGMSLEDVELIHARKTGALFAACTKVGGRIGGLSGSRLDDMAEFGMCLGLAFQTYDDLADVHSDEATAGKDVNNDADKETLVSILGRAQAEALADRHIEQALSKIGAAAAGASPLGVFVHHLTDALKKRIDVKR